APGPRGFRDELDFRRPERIGLVERGVRHRLIGFDHGQRLDLAAHVLGPVLQLGLEVTELFPAARGEEQAESDYESTLHFFAADFAARLCAATSSSSR